MINKSKDTHNTKKYCIIRSERSFSNPDLDRVNFYVLLICEKEICDDYTFPSYLFWGGGGGGGGVSKCVTKWQCLLIF